VPNLQRLPGTHVTVFARSKTWISPSFGQGVWDAHGFEGFSIPESVRERFRTDPEFYHKFRLAVEEDGNKVFAATIKGTPVQLGAKQVFTEHMRQRLASKPHIFEALLPSFSPGCRRLTPGPGYLEALTQPNVSFITSHIARISESAVHTKDGETHEIDTLVCATGFQAGAPPPFPIYGAHNITLTEKWAQRPVTYMTHSISQFPNLFLMLGPNAAIGSGSLTSMIEALGDFMVKVVRKIQKENIARMVVKKEREEDFIEYVDEYFKGTVFGEGCTSWYKSGSKDGKVTGLWPGSTLHCMEVFRSPRWEDYVYRYVGEDPDEEEEDTRVDSPITNGNGLVNGDSTKGKKKRVNRLAWLGNGWTKHEMEERDLAWYLYPEFLQKPAAPLPEDNVLYKARTFSY
jgi:hypothetical protein